MSLSVYESFLLNNSSRAFSIESSARSLTWILPGRFQDSDLVSEGLYAALEVLGLYHDTILQKAINSIPPHLRPKPSSHSRYTSHFTSTSKTYAFLARTLTILTYTELLLEMSVKKKLNLNHHSSIGENVIITIEGLKVLLRLSLMKLTQGRTNVQPSIPEREIDSSILEKYENNLSSNRRIEGTAQRRYQQQLQQNGGIRLPRSAADVLFVGAGNREERGEGINNNNNNNEGEGEEEAEEDTSRENLEYWTGKRTGIIRPTIASIRSIGGVSVTNHDEMISGDSVEVREAVSEYLMSKVLTVEDVKRPEDLINKAKGLGKLAEIIWILRPFIYVLAMRKYGKRHTFPYLLSLAIEYLALSLRKTAAKRLAINKSTGAMLPHILSEAEKAETRKRSMAFWLYAVRGPVWELITKPKLNSIANTFEDKPLIGFVSTLIKDYLPLVDEYYFYTSR